MDVETAFKANGSCSGALVKARKAAQRQEAEALVAAELREKPFYALVRLYILADTLSVLGLRDQIITCLILTYGRRAKTCDSEELDELFWGNYSTWTGPFNIRDIIRLAHEHFRFDPLTRLLSILYCDAVNEETQMLYGHTLDAAFLSLALTEMRLRWIERETFTQWQLPGKICKYHKHDVPCALNN